MSKGKAIVLLSSGLDSTINLYESLNEFESVMALTFNYGQKAFSKEAEYSKAICDKLNIKHIVVDIPWLKDVSSSSSLTNLASDIPTDSVDITSLEASKESAKSVWVSNRNGLFINIAACFAEENKYDSIVVGFNKEEAATFPDNSKEFIEQINNSLHYSTSNHVKVKSFTVDMMKPEIVQRGRKLNVDFELVWPCYYAGDKICGKCESCKRYIAAQ